MNKRDFLISLKNKGFDKQRATDSLAAFRSSGGTFDDDPVPVAASPSAPVTGQNKVSSVPTPAVLEQAGAVGALFPNTVQTELNRQPGENPVKGFARRTGAAFLDVATAPGRLATGTMRTVAGLQSGENFEDAATAGIRNIAGVGDLSSNKGYTKFGEEMLRSPFALVGGSVPAAAGVAGRAAASVIGREIAKKTIGQLAKEGSFTGVKYAIPATIAQEAGTAGVEGKVRPTNFGNIGLGIGAGAVMGAALPLVGTASGVLVKAPIRFALEKIAKKTPAQVKAEGIPTIEEASLKALKGNDLNEIIDVGGESISIKKVKQPKFLGIISELTQAEANGLAAKKAPESIPFNTYVKQAELKATNFDALDPAEVASKQAMKAMEAMRESVTAAGKSIDEIVEQNLDKKINIAAEKQAFKDMVQKRLGGLGEGPEGQLMADEGAREPIMQILQQLEALPDEINPRTAWMLKRNLRSRLTYALNGDLKTANPVLDGIVNELSAMVDKKMDAMPGFKDANEKFSSEIRILKLLRQRLGEEFVPGSGLTAHGASVMKRAILSPSDNGIRQVFDLVKQATDGRIDLKQDALYANVAMRLSGDLDQWAKSQTFNTALAATRKIPGVGLLQDAAKIAGEVASKMGGGREQRVSDWYVRQQSPAVRQSIGQSLGTAGEAVLQGAQRAAGSKIGQIGATVGGAGIGGVVGAAEGAKQGATPQEKLAGAIEGAAVGAIAGAGVGGGIALALSNPKFVGQAVKDRGGYVNISLGSDGVVKFFTKIPEIAQNSPVSKALRAVFDANKNNPMRDNPAVRAIGTDYLFGRTTLEEAEKAFSGEMSNDLFGNIQDVAMRNREKQAQWLGTRGESAGKKNWTRYPAKDRNVETARANKKTGGINTQDFSRGCVSGRCTACYAANCANQAKKIALDVVPVTLKGDMRKSKGVTRFGEVGEPNTNPVAFNRIKSEFQEIVKRAQESGKVTDIDAMNKFLDDNGVNDWSYAVEQLKNVNAQHPSVAKKMFFITKLNSLQGFDPSVIRNLHVSIDPMIPSHFFRSLKNVEKLLEMDPTMNVTLRIKSIPTVSDDINSMMLIAAKFAKDKNLPVLETRTRFRSNDELGAVMADESLRRKGNQIVDPTYKSSGYKNIAEFVNSHPELTEQKTMTSKGKQVTKKVLTQEGQDAFEKQVRLSSARTEKEGITAFSPFAKAVELPEGNFLVCNKKNFNCATCGNCAKLVTRGSAYKK